MADYESDVREAAANRGRRMAWLICDVRVEAKRRRSDPVGSIFDSPKGPLFEATVWQFPLLKDKEATGRRQKPGRQLESSGEWRPGIMAQPDGLFNGDRVGPAQRSGERKSTRRS